MASSDALFYTKRGLLTRYAFACGYIERKGNLSLHREHGVYHIRGFCKDDSGREYRVTGSFYHVAEARKCLANPFKHAGPNITITRVKVGSIPWSMTLTLSVEEKTILQELVQDKWHAVDAKLQKKPSDELSAKQVSLHNLLVKLEG